MLHDSHNIVVFTDGSSRGNPGPGGFGVVIVYNDSEWKVESGKWKVNEIGGREEHTTNNRMELTAAIKALQSVSSLNAIRYTLYADSSYVVNGITKWIHGWQKNGWKTGAKKDVENRDLWEKLIEISRNKEIQWKSVKGHAGVPGNTRCDEIATAFADGEKPQLYSGIFKNYSIKNILDVSEGRTGKGLTFLPTQGQTLRSPSAKTRSRQTSYSYVSKVNGVIQTHKTWAECEQRVRGKQAKYKKAFSAEEERNLIEKWGTH